MKSAKSDTQNAISPSQNHAVLCTNDQTFNVRQVQSSNSVYLLQSPQSSPLSNEFSTPQPIIRAIAQCPTTLELIPAHATGVSFLRQILPVFKGPLVDPKTGNESIGETNEQDTSSKQEAFENIPLSPREFDKAWEEVCAFEMEGHAWVPSPKLLKGLWESIVSAAAVEGVNLVNKFHVPALRGMVEEDGFPNALLNSVLERVCVDHEDRMNGCMWNFAQVYQSRNPVDNLLGAVLNRDKCVSWVGEILLEELSIPDQAVAESDFLNNWKNQLPEEWRKHAALSALKVMHWPLLESYVDLLTMNHLQCKYSRSSNGRIVFDMDFVGGSGSAVANANGKQPGKWHEKFKSTRR